jgi:hypothetical protein
MSKLESQIAKIHLSNQRSAQNYVYVMAEKASGSDAELYMVAELPVFNPAAYAQCEQICLAVAGSLRRAFKRPLEESTFENAIAQINEELAKLVETGQDYWVNKFNCVLAVKNQNALSVATCGKTAAFLLREGQFSNIGVNKEETHPLKTFDSFATGKIRLGDVLIFSNTQLLNFLSLDRLKEILKKESFLAAAQTVIELLKETADPGAAFGTILNMQVPLGQTATEEMDLESYVVENPAQVAFFQKIINFIKNLTGAENQARENKAALPKISSSERFAQIKGAGGKFLRGAQSAYGDFSKKLKNAGQVLSPSQVKQFSPAKKYLFFAIVICVISAGLMVSAAVYNKNVKQKKAVAAAKIKAVKDSLSLAESSLLYKDEEQARIYFSKAETQMPKESELFKEHKEDYAVLIKKLEDFKNQADKKTVVTPENLGSLAEGSVLITLPEYLAVQAGKNLISYEKQTGKIEDGKLKTEQSITASVGVKSGTAVIYSGESLMVWDYNLGSTGSPLISSVPAKENFVGFAYYPTNSRAYLIDKQKNQLISFLVGKNNLQKPVVALTSQNLSEAQSLAIDGNVYVLTPTGINKFSAGKQNDFTMPSMFEAFSGQGKLITQIGWENLYLLDISKKRVLIINKQGNLVKTLVSENFDNLKDFAVDESQMTIWLLNGSNLLKINY